MRLFPPKHQKKFIFSYHSDSRARLVHCKSIEGIFALGVGVIVYYGGLEKLK